MHFWKELYWFFTDKAFVELFSEMLILKLKKEKNFQVYILKLFKRSFKKNLSFHSKTF